MPRYTYIAKTQPRETSRGYIDAESEQDAVEKLTKMGHFPISVKYETLELEKPGMMNLRKISNRDIAQFSRQLYSLIEAGINILKALNMIADQTPNKYLATIIRDLSGRIKDGKSLSDSLSAFPNLFSNLYCSMVRTGEASGHLNTTLKELTDFLDEEEEFKNSLRAGLTYPAIVFAASALTVIGLLVFVVPRLIPMFEDMGQALPLPTQILINISNSLRSQWWMITAALLILVFTLRRIYKTPKGRMAWHRLKLKLFILGNIILKTEISRLSRTLSLLLSSGLSITPALDISASIIENEVLKTEVEKFKGEISGGKSLSSSFKSSKLFPELVINIIAIGEETGSLDKSLMGVACDYEGEVSRALKEITRLLEPVVILVMGLIVGFIVLSMLLPIFQINLIMR